MVNYVKILIRVNAMSERDNREKHISLDEIEEMEQKEIEESSKGEKRIKFNIFTRFQKEGKGVDPDEVKIADDPKLVNFFKLVGRKLNQLLSINLFVIFGNFPIFFFLLALTRYFSIHSTAPIYSAYAPLYGIMKFGESSPALASLWTIFSRRQDISIMSVADWILIGLGLLVIFTFGPVRVGITYILRNMFRGEPVFMWHDFWYAIKRNLKQALIYGVMDVIIIFLIVFDIMFFNLNYNSSLLISIFFFMILFLALLYYLMRTYIYLMLVTFDLSIPKLLKNGLLFSVLGIKRNLMFVLGTLILALFEYFLMIVYVPLAVIVPFIILPSLILIMGVYAAYPKIKEIMIDPYYEEHPQEAEEAQEKEPNET